MESQGAVRIQTEEEAEQVCKEVGCHLFYILRILIVCLPRRLFMCMRHPDFQRFRVANALAWGHATAPHGSERPCRPGGLQNNVVGQFLFVDMPNKHDWLNPCRTILSNSSLIDTLPPVCTGRP